MHNRPFQDLTARALAEAANANLVTHVSWIQARTPGMSVHAAPDLVLVDSGLPCDTFNIVCRARLDPATAPERIQAVIAANWTPSDPLVLRFYDQAAPVLLTPAAALWPYVGYLGDVPVAAAELTGGGGVVGLYNICTLAAHRRQGFGTALTLQPLLDAHTLGYRTAILQASAAGAQIYAHLGFTTFGKVTEYKPPMAWAILQIRLPPGPNRQLTTSND